MKIRLGSLLLFFGVLNFSCLAQGAFYVGAKIGAGGNVFPFYALLDVKGNVDNVYAGTTLSTGIIVNYMIAERIGFETGLNAVHYSYYKSEMTYWRKRIWKGSAAMEIADVQFPLLFLYKYNFPSKPFIDVTFSGGTSIDWLAPNLLIKPSGPMWLKNVMCCLRLGKEKMKGARWEYGIEFQYSLDRYTENGTNYDELDYKINSRLSLLTLNLYYFFFNRKIA
jgi:hypothetical protein